MSERYRECQRYIGIVREIYRVSETYWECQRDIGSVIEILGNGDIGSMIFSVRKDR